MTAHRSFALSTLPSLGAGGLLLGALLGALTAPPAAAQDMSPADRTAALARVRSFAACMERHQASVARVMRLISESERQRDRATDARVRADAERAIESLIAQAATLQREARGCVNGDDLPSPGTRVVVQAPPPDHAADVVAGTGGTVREIEADARLSAHVRVERGEQVDGQGQLPASVVSAAIRRISPQIDRCYEQHLERGSASPASLNLVFTVRATQVRDVAVERSGFSDAAFERCVRAAGQRIRVGRAPAGGDAIYDDCGECVGGTTGREPCVLDTADTGGTDVPSTTGGTTPGTTPTGGTTPTDPGTDPTTPGTDDTGFPAPEPVSYQQVGGCGCASAPSGWGWWLLAASPLVLLRRR